MGLISSTCLFAVLTRADPKSENIYSSCQYLFALLGSACAEALRKILMKLRPETSLSRVNPFVTF